MTGLDTKWETCEGSAEKQKIVMVVHFRPDNLPKDHAQWYEWLGNYAHTTSQLLKKGILPSAEVKTVTDNKIRMAIPSKCSLGSCDDNIFSQACICILKLGDCARYKDLNAMFADTIDKLPEKNKSTGLLRAVLSCPWAVKTKTCPAVTWLEAATRPKEKKTQ